MSVTAVYCKHDCQNGFELMYKNNPHVESEWANNQPLKLNVALYKKQSMVKYRYWIQNTDRINASNRSQMDDK